MIRSLLSLAFRMGTPAKRVPIPPRGVDYRGKVVLAPMVRSGELPSRLLALKYGADLVWGPETIDKAMIGTTRRVNPRTGMIEFSRFPTNAHRPDTKASIIYRLHPEQEHNKLIFQIGTANPETAVQAARLVAPDVAGIDVNAGCPKSFSTDGGMGAALLKTPEKLASILEALVSEIGEPYEIGISVKIRLLETPEKTAALVSRLVATGITGLTVHCRTTPMRPREKAIREQLSMVGDLCREAGVACLMNGDVTNYDEGLQLAEQYGIDGAMIATAAEANSSVFRRKTEGGRLRWPDVSREYMRLALAVENRFTNTKFLLAQLMPGKEEAAKNCQRAKCYLQACEAIGLEDFYGRAKEVDDVLGLTQWLKDKAEQAKKHENAEQLQSQRESKKQRKDTLVSVDHDSPLLHGNMGQAMTAMAT